MALFVFLEAVTAGTAEEAEEDETADGTEDDTLDETADDVAAFFACVFFVGVLEEQAVADSNIKRQNAAETAVCERFLC